LVEWFFLFSGKENKFSLMILGFAGTFKWFGRRPAGLFNAFSQKKNLIKKLYGIDSIENS
jgi:hypothetical protein